MERPALQRAITRCAARSDYTCTVDSHPFRSPLRQLGYLGCCRIRLTVGSEVARLRANHRPSRKLHVRFSRMQLSRRLGSRRCNRRDQADKINHTMLAVQARGGQGLPSRAPPAPMTENGQVPWPRLPCVAARRPAFRLLAKRFARWSRFLLVSVVARTPPATGSRDSNAAARSCCSRTAPR